MRPDDKLNFNYQIILLNGTHTYITIYHYATIYMLKKTTHACYYTAKVYYYWSIVISVNITLHHNLPTQTITRHYTINKTNTINYENSNTPLGCRLSKSQERLIRKPSKQLRQFSAFNSTANPET